MSRPIRDFALEVHFSKYEFAARFNLTGSDAESHTLEEILALGREEDRQAFLQMRLGYTETYGAPALREAIARTYDSAAIASDRILTFAGAQEALYVVSRVLLEPDDHAVVITPNYQSAETMPATICAATGVPLDPERGWRLDVDQVIAAMRPNTRLVSINFPNNPTGAIIPEASLQAIVEACRARGAWLLSDEVYRLIEADPARRLPQAADIYERALSLNVLSKAYGLPGLRIGWIACQDRDLLVRLERYKHYLSICNSAPSEVLGRIALDHREPILRRNRAIVAANLDLLDAFFAEHQPLFDWRRPDGSCVAFPRYLGKDGVEAFAQQLVEEAGVLLLPASIYRSDLMPTPTDRFRIGFGHRHTADALAVFDAWLKGAAGVRIIRLPELRAAFDRDAILAVVERALIDQAAGRVQSPPPGQILFRDPSGDCHVKYGHVAGADSFAVKIATGFYGNPTVGLPVNNGLILTFDARTGAPTTLLLDEGWLTAWRTAAATALAATRLAPVGARAFGVVGAGLQADLALAWIGGLRPDWRRLVWARDAGKSAALAARAGARCANRLDELIDDADIIVTTTPSTTPLFASEQARPGQLFVGVGADSPGKQELPPALFARAAWIAVDDMAQCADHGDWGSAVRQGFCRPDSAIRLGDVLAGAVQLDWARGEVGVVDLTGIAAEDIAIAGLFSERTAAPGRHDSGPAD